MQTASIPRHILSKSTFMYGCQCPKRLWLHKHMPEVRDEQDEAQTAIFQRGTDVGLLARQLFPGGIDASPKDPFSYQQSVAATEAYIKQGHAIIYEAAFQYEGVLCAVDILVKEKGKWYAYEVKSSTSVKEPNIMDAALQYYVITNTGLKLENISIVHLNNNYIRYGELDTAALFTIQSVLFEVQGMQKEIADKAGELKKIAKLTVVPEMITGGQCMKPYPCDFYGHCSSAETPVEMNYGVPAINKAAIKSFIKTLEYPLYFMDFETWMTAVPEQDGHWPYRQINFQYSMHVQHKKGGPLDHYCYLAEGTHINQKEFIESLLKVSGRKGSIVVYNKTFENCRLNELKDDYPELASVIGFLQGRMVDLMTPFRRKDYYLPAMAGSYSIKNVLPALVPELSYTDLTIGNGGDASAAFYNLKNETDPQKIEEIRNALLKYCEMDTFAMVKVLEKLMKVT